MKVKYIVTTKNGAVVGVYDAKSAAEIGAVDYATKHNDGLNEKDPNYLTLFDFKLEAKAIPDDPSELIPNFDAACRYLQISESIPITTKDNYCITCASKAFYKLCTIAEAWNKIDGFVPDFGNRDQYKYYPWFECEKESAGFVYAATHYTTTAALANIGPRLCFATRNRAEQFGRMFQDLYNQMFW